MKQSRSNKSKSKAKSKTSAARGSSARKVGSARSKTRNAKPVSAKSRRPVAKKARPSRSKATTRAVSRKRSNEISIPSMRELGQEVVSSIRSVLPTTTKGKSSRGKKKSNSILRAA